MAWNLVVLKTDENRPDSGFISRESLGDVLIDWMQSMRIQQGAKASEQLVVRTSALCKTENIRIPAGNILL